MKIKAVLFDLDDTLVLTRETKFEAIKYTAKTHYNLDIEDSKIEKYWGRPFNEVMQGIFGDVDSVDGIVAKYLPDRMKFPSIAYPDANDVIQLLILRGYKVGVISSTTKQFVIHDLMTLGFPVDDLSVIQGAEDTKYHKPDPRVFDPAVKILHESGIRNIECLYVGDLIGDYYSARDAGMQFLGIVRWGTTKEDFEKAGAKTIQSLSEIIGLLTRA